MRENVCSNNQVKPLIVTDDRRLQRLQLEKAAIRMVIVLITAKNSNSHNICFMQARSESADHPLKSVWP